MPETDALSAADRLAVLEVAVSDADDRYREARRRVEREWSVTAETTDDLSQYRDDVQFKRRESSIEDQLRLTRELFERIEDRGLVLEASGGGRGLLIVRDPSLVQEAEDARVAVNDAKRELSAFRAEHDGAIEAERKRVEAEAIREALAGDDPDKLREALASGRNPRMMVTSDQVTFS